MSKVVDERIVSMQFDNKQFESNVRTSMSTLERLKQSLNFKGASKGFDNLSAAAKNVKMEPMINGIEKVGLKFNWMYTIADQTLRNITNSVEAAASRTVKAFTIDPIKSGFQEYETQINAVQTILANTSHAGTSLDEVNQALDELNHYADMTIYNFTEMTRNIGTFTAAGVDLQTSVDSIQGIANLAAVSGSTSQQASTAMYQLSQALAAGKVSLMDWNSVVNAGMGGKVFQDALVRTSELLGTGAQNAIDTYGSFRESLTKGEWLTTQVLTETLKQFAGAYSKADLINQGFTEDQAEAISKMATTATEAATKVKTFTQLMDTLKEAAQSGWTQTWEILIGDFEEAKELFTNISDFLGNIINKSAESRNSVLEGSMTSGWEKLTKKINEAGIETEVFEDKVKSILSGRGVDVDGLIKQYGSLEKAFQNGAIHAGVIKTALNSLDSTVSKIKNTLRIGDASEEVKALQTALENAGFTLEEFGVDGKFGKETEEAIKKFQEAKGLVADGIVGPETQKAINEYTGGVGKLGDELDDLIKGVDDIGGRAKIIESFKNAFEGLAKIFRIARNAWKYVFPPKSTEEKVAGLTKIIDAIHNFSEKLIMNRETSLKVFQAFKALFNILSLVRTVVGGGLTAVFKLLTGVLSKFDLHIVDIIGYVADALNAFYEWITANDILNKAFDGLCTGIAIFVSLIASAAGKVVEWVQAFWALPEVQAGVEKIGNAFKEAWTNTKEFFSGGLEFLNGFFEKLKNVKSIDDITGVVTDFGKSIKKYFENAKNPFSGIIAAVTGFAKTIGDKFRSVGDTFTWVKDKLKEFVDYVLSKWPQLLTVFTAFLAIKNFKKLVDIMGALKEPAEALSGAIDKVGKSISKFVKAKAFEAKTQGIRNIAVSIGILAAAIWVLAKIPKEDLLWALGAITVLTVAMMGLSAVVGKMSNLKDIGQASVALLSLSGALAIMAYVIKYMGELDPTVMEQGVVCVGILITFVGALAWVSQYAGDHADEAGKMMIKIGAALALMAIAMKIIGGMDQTDLDKGTNCVLALGVLVTCLIAVSKLAGKDADKAGQMIMKVGMALLSMVFVIKMISKLSNEDIARGIIVIGAFEILVWALTKVTAKAGPNADKAGSMILKIGIGLLAMVAVIAIMSLMSPEDILIGVAAITALGVFVSALVLVSKFAGEHADQAGKMMIKIGVALLLMASAIALISLLDPADVVVGVAALGALMIFMTILIAVTKKFEEAKGRMGTLVMLTIMIGVLTACVSALSLLDPTGVATGTACVSALMVMVGVLAKMVSKTGDTVKKALSTLLIMTGVVGILAAILYLLSGLPVESTLAVAASLSTLLLSLSAACGIMAYVGTVGSVASAGLIQFMATLGLISAVILLIGGIATLIPGGAQAIEEIGEMLYSIGEAVGSFVGGLSAGVMSGLPAIGKSLSQFGKAVQPFITMASGVSGDSMEGVKKLAEMILILTAAELLDAVVGKITGVHTLTSFAQELPALGLALAAFSILTSNIKSEQISQVADAALALTKVANAVPAEDGFLQKVVGVHNMATFAAALPDLGQSLQEFGTYVTDVNSEQVSKVADAALALTKVANAVPAEDGFLQKLTGVHNMSKFAGGLKELGGSLKDFNASITEGDGINTGQLSKVATAALKLTEVANAVPAEGSIFDKLTGVRSMSSFAGGLKELGGALKSLNESVEADTLDSTKLDTISTAVTSLIGVSQAIAQSGGEGVGDLIARAIGLTPTMKEFAGEMTTLGGAIKTMSEDLGDVSDADINKITLVSGGIEALIAAGKSLEGYDGAGWLSDGALTKFSKEFGDIGKNLSTMSDNLEGVDVGAIETASTAIRKLAGVASVLSSADLSSADGIEDSIKTMGRALNTAKSNIANIGKVDMSNAILFTVNIKRFATNLKLAHASLSGVTTEAFSRVKSAVDTLVLTLAKVDSAKTGKVDNFTAAVKKLGAVKVDASALSATSRSVKASVDSMMKSMSSSVSSQKSSMNSSIKTALSGTAGAIKASTNSNVQAMNTLLSALVKAITSKKSAVTSAFKSLTSGAAGAIKGNRSTFVSAGGYLGDGLVSGIKSKYTAAYQAGYTLGQKAAQGEKDGQQSHSPSKLTIQAGKWLGEGLIIGINRMGDKAYSAGYDLGSTATKSISKAISRVSDAIDGGMDVQPTIRPVVDLTSVKAGAGAIDGMFGMIPSVGVMTNLRSISSSMNSRNQNGVNADVVSAINKLGKTMSGNGGNTYQINGITYSNGTEVSDAVRTLVRAATMERRM